MRKHSEKTKIAWPKIMQSKIENTQFSTKREKGKVYRGGALTRWRADSAVAVSAAACTAAAVATVAVAPATFSRNGMLCGNIATAAGAAIVLASVAFTAAALSAAVSKASRNAVKMHFSSAVRAR